MNREKISEALNEIDDRYLEEAIRYEKPAGKRGRMKWAAAAACLVLLFIGGGVLGFLHGSMVVSAYAYGTDEEITAAGAVIHTGTIDDDGLMTGHPLMFYLSGRNIAAVRFSCKYQILEFVDWTEKRAGYGNAQNFTVEYGEDESEYYYLTIDWVPDAIIRELTDNENSTIASLPEEMRGDLIVMEITFENGRTVTKAITVTLLDDGTFSASFDDYTISEEDTFVNRPDSEGVPEKVSDDQGNDGSDGFNETASLSEEELEDARQAALAYYSNTVPVFTVNSMEYIEDDRYEEDKGILCVFAVNVSKDGVVQDPDRRIVLRLVDGAWEVVSEGY